MANLTITPASVFPPSSNPQTTANVAGEALVRGQVVYLAADNKWYKADCTSLVKSGNGEGSGKLRVVLADVSTDQIVLLLEPGQTYTVGATVSIGKLYALSATATSGLICLNTDLVTGNYLTTLGIARTTSTIDFFPNSTGVLIP